jgi:hypothetical protein
LIFKNWHLILSNGVRKDAVSWSGRLFDCNQAITSMVLAERLAAGYGEDGLFVVGWREELGL